MTFDDDVKLLLLLLFVNRLKRAACDASKFVFNDEADNSVGCISENEEAAAEALAIALCVGLVIKLCAFCIEDDEDVVVDAIYLYT